MRAQNCVSVREHPVSFFFSIFFLVSNKEKIQTIIPTQLFEVQKSLTFSRKVFEKIFWVFCVVNFFRVNRFAAVKILEIAVYFLPVKLLKTAVFYIDNSSIFNKCAVNILETQVNLMGKNIRSWSIFIENSSIFWK